MVVVAATLACTTEPPRTTPTPKPTPKQEAAPDSAWYEVVAQAPGPEFTDPAMRAAVEASGHPWKVRDRATGIELVLVLPGDFDMGSPATEEGRQGHEGPQHRVRISHAFYLGTTEVSQRTWEGLMGSTTSFFPGPELPVSPSWRDVDGFLARANAAVGSGTPPLRLPTEAEWEYASRAGTTTPHCLPDSVQGPALHTVMNFNDGEISSAVVVDGRLQVEWSTPPSPGCRMTTVPVGSLPPNRWGLHEMHGNLWEWTADAYRPDAYAERGALTVDPFVSGPASGLHTLRGGSWYDPAAQCRAASRDAGGADVQSNRIGFRVARTAGSE